MLDIVQWTPEFFKQNENECRDYLKDLRNWRQIPLLDHRALLKYKNYSLIRFRGMIQDILNNEIYLEKYELKSKENNTVRIQDGRFLDHIIVNDNESIITNIHGDRQTFYIISIPGKNPWVKEFENDFNKNNNQTSDFILKRPATFDEDDKRKRFKGEEEKINQISSLSLSSSPSSSSSTNNRNTYIQNSPIKDRPSHGCMVKIYSNHDNDNYILNSVVDIVGFLSLDPVYGGDEDEDVFTNQQSSMAVRIPCPCLHAIVLNKLEHINPLLDISLINEDISNINPEIVHKDLLIILTQCLFGDAIAAEYLLSHLISTIYGRTDLRVLGKFTLNISNIPINAQAEYTQALYEIIELLLPASHYFPMTVENMNTIQFIPKKEYSTNKLISGLLQLAPHTHLVLDETRLQPGKLEENGVLGVQNIANLIDRQQFKCNFEFYEIFYDANVPVLILSEGKSMFPSDFHIPLKIDSDSIPLIGETLKTAKHYIQPKLNVFRKYLTTAKIQKFNITDVISDMIQNEFVELRKHNRIDPEHLHSALVFSRYVGIARGQIVLDKNSWNLAMEYEKERRKRINERT